MPEFPGFCGPAYQSQSIAADNQRLINWYVNHDESGLAKSEFQLFPTPGLRFFIGGSATKIRGVHKTADAVLGERMFSVGDGIFGEIFADGTAVQRGTGLVDDGQPVSIASSQVEVIIASGGAVYLFTLATNVFTALPAGTMLGLISVVAFCDGYFIALLANSNQFQISGLLNGSSWNAADTTKVSVFPDNIVSMIVDHRLLVIMGQTKSVIYKNTGAVFPFEVVDSGYVEIGSEAIFSAVRLDNGVFFLGADDRGGGRIYRSSGFTPQRISTFAIENEIQGYSKRSDAVAYGFQYLGESFYQIYFPTADRTWRYAVSTGFWHEVKSTIGGVQRAHLSWMHVYCFGKHLVGDWNSGNIYEMGAPQYDFGNGVWMFCDDNGAFIRRTRRTPYVAAGNKRISYNELRLEVEPGLGPGNPLVGGTATVFVLAGSGGTFWRLMVADDGSLRTDADLGPSVILQLNDPGNTTTWTIAADASGFITTTAATFNSAVATSAPMVSVSGTVKFNLLVTSSGFLQTDPQGPAARDPQIFLRWSDDNGNNWSNERILDCGQSGQYAKRVIARRLGMDRFNGRVFEFSSTDAWPQRIIGGDLKAG